MYIKIGEWVLYSGVLARIKVLASPKVWSFVIAYFSYTERCSTFKENQEHLNEIRNIWTLAKSGFLHKEKRSLKATIFLGLKLYGILILMKLISVGLLYLLNLFNIFNMPSNIGGENLRTYNPIIQIIIVAVYVPIVEELAFRIGLKFSKWNFTIASIAMVLSTSRVIFQIEWTYCIIICIVFGIILYLILKDRAVNFLSKVGSEC